MAILPSTHVVPGQLPLTVAGLTLIERLGAGGMAEVFLAERGRGERVVVKRMLPHLVGNGHFLSLFRREAETGRRVVHEHVVRTLDFVDDASGPMIVLEYIDGVTLRALAKAAFDAKLPVPLGVVLRLLADAALGLEAIHAVTDEQGLPFVHRDISPDNLIVSKTDGAVRVLDFGVARPGGEGALTKTGEIRGKIAFMPPEQVQALPLDGRADLYALGVTAFWMLSGRRPFRDRSELALMQKIVHDPAPRLKSKAPRVPDDVDALVASLLAKNKAGRPKTARDVHDALVRVGAAPRDRVQAFLDSLAPTNERNTVVERPQQQQQQQAPPVSPVEPTVRAPLDRGLSAAPTLIRTAPGGDSDSDVVDANASTRTFHALRNRAAAGDGVLRETLEVPLEESSEWGGRHAEDDASDPETRQTATAAARPGPPTTRLALAGIGLLGLVTTAAAITVALRPLDDEPELETWTRTPATPLASDVVPASGGRVDGASAGGDGRDVGGGVDGGGVAVVDAGTVTAGAVAPASPTDAPIAAVADERESARDMRETRDARASPSTKRPVRSTANATKRADSDGKRTIAIVNAPRSVVWSTGLRGSGTLEVPSSTKTLRARIDELEGVVDVAVADTIDWTTLPRGDLSVRSLTQVTIYVGKRPFGTTPRDDIPLVAGRYPVRIVHGDGREEKRSVDVTRGKVVVKAAQ